MRTAGIRQRRIGLGVVSTLVALLVALPTLIVIPMSFTGEQSFSFPPQSWSLQWYRSFFQSQAWRSSLIFSLEVACCVTVLATVVGILIALGLRRLPGRFASVGQSVVLIPIIIPAIVTAISIYEIFLRWHLSGTLLGFTLAQSTVVLPFVVLSVGVGLSRINPRLVQAAATLGARPVGVFFRVILPLMLPAVLTAMLLAFVGSLDEPVIALFLSTPTQMTLPVQMYDSMLQVTDPTIAAASSILLALAVFGGLIGLVLLPYLRRSRRAERA
jgi:putative spermidine/putrescine transport system permease protein